MLFTEAIGVGYVDHDDGSDKRKDVQLLEALLNDYHLSDTELTTAERLVFGMIKNLEGRGRIDWRKAI